MQRRGFQAVPVPESHDQRKGFNLSHPQRITPVIELNPLSPDDPNVRVDSGFPSLADSVLLRVHTNKHYACCASEESRTRRCLRENELLVGHHPESSGI